MIVFACWIPIAMFVLQPFLSNGTVGNCIAQVGSTRCTNTFDLIYCWIWNCDSGLYVGCSMQKWQKHVVAFTCLAAIAKCIMMGMGIVIQGSAWDAVCRK